MPVQVQLVGPDRAHPGGDPLPSEGIRRGVAVRRADRGEVLDRRRDPGETLEVAGSGLEPIGGGYQFVGRQRVEDVGPAVENARVRTKELVCRAGEEVRSDRAEVDRQWGRGME